MTLPSGATVTYQHSGYNKDASDLSLLYLDPIASKTVHWADLAAQDEVSTYSFTTSTSTFTGADGGQTTNTFVDTATASLYQGLVYRVQEPDGSLIDRGWSQNPPANCTGQSACNPYVQAEFRTPTGGQAAGTLYSIDQNGNTTLKTEYDWTSYSNIHFGTVGPTGFNSGVSLTPLRTTVNTYNSSVAYWNLPAPTAASPPASAPLDLLTRTSASGIGLSAVAEFDYGDTSGHQNVKEERHWDSERGSATNPLQTSNSDVTTYTYDPHGNRASAQNAHNATNWTYDASGVCVVQTVVAGAGIQRTFSSSCDASTGVSQSQSDVDHSITSTFTSDKFGRRRSITDAPTGGNTPSRSKTINYYDGSRNTATVTAVTSSSNLTDTVWFDRLGRSQKTTDTVGNTVATDYYVIKVATNGCSAPGTYKVVSNPYLTGSEKSAGWTRTLFDTMGRPQEVRHFDGNSKPCPWGSNTVDTGHTAYSYSGNSTTITDESGLTSTRYVDGLGRLTRVVENNGQSTSYSYDAQGNLTMVQPASGATRTFEYDSRNRLTKATNPETSVPITYAYDANGNLTSRTVGQIVTAYVYDGLDELIAKNYTGETPPTTPNATYTYNKGWLVSSTAGATTRQQTTFDGIGRVLASSQQTNGQPYTFSYSYDMVDHVTNVTLPSGRQLAMSYDGDGRPLSVGPSPNGSPKYADSVTYAPFGAIQQYALGNALSEQTCFNSRLRPTVIRQRTSATMTCGIAGVADAPQDSSDVGYLSFAFRSNGDNGDVASQTIHYAAYGSNPVFNATQTYTYDGLNGISGVDRLNSVSETGGSSWHQTYGYDVVGNRWLQDGLQIDPLTPTGNGYDANNHLTAWGYDARGNVNQVGGYTYQYDAENRITASQLGSNGLVLNATTYAYDADGRRVSKTANSVTTVYVYDAFGSLTAEYATGPASALAVPPCTTCYLMDDHLDTTRMQTDAAGHAVQLCDYAPFGEMLTNYGGRTDSRWCGAGAGPGFTGKERDSESGLDYFGARYYSGAQGRFTSPDWSATPQPVPYADLTDPQTLNLYTYVRNNPLSRTDPDGHCCFFENLNTVAKQSVQVFQTAGTEMATALNKGAQVLSENPNFSISHISTTDLNNIGKNLTLMIATGEVGEAAGPARVLSEEGTVTRYMGSGEAATVLRTGEIPNTNAAGEFRPTHVTTDAPLNSAAQAQTTYELPSAPTHRATVPASRVNDLQGTPDGRATTSGGGSQAATHKPIPVKPKELKKLNQ